MVNHGNFVLNGYLNNESFNIPNIYIYQSFVCCHKYVRDAFTSVFGHCDTLMQLSAIQNPLNHLQSLVPVRPPYEENTTTVNGSHVQFNTPIQGGELMCRS